MKNVQYEAFLKLFSQGSINLEGGGQVCYISNPSEEKIKRLSNNKRMMIHEGCENTNTSKKTKYQARCNFVEDFLKMNARNIVVYGAGHHQERSTYILIFKTSCQCMQDTKSEPTFKRWHHYFMSQLACVDIFWTKGGTYGGEEIELNGMSCQSSVVPFISNTMDVENLGGHHVWHGDGLHWLQPGIPDLYAGKLADFLLSASNKKRSKDS